MAALVSDWFQRWQDPPGHRVRQRRHLLDQFPRKATWFGVNTTFYLRGWYRPLSEPVRRKPPLPIGALPHLFQVQSHIGYSFALTETADVAALSFAVYTPKNLARVAITEIKVDSAESTMNEVRYDRGYS